MALFGEPSAFVGIDIGTSNLKIVELVRRKKRIEVATYAQANIPNLLVSPQGDVKDAIQKVARVISTMMDKAGVSSDTVIAALPSTIVFSTVLELPKIPDEEMEKAVRFAARDVVPADLDEMVLGWSMVGEEPHMATDSDDANTDTQEEGEEDGKDRPKQPSAENASPVFVTAAPQNIVERYTEVMNTLQLKLHALEVETSPLTRSLLSNAKRTGMIVDIGDLATTFHIIDAGTPRVSHTIDYGGKNITEQIAQAMNISFDEAEQQKAAYGLTQEAPEKQRTATQLAVEEQVNKAQSLMSLYQKKSGKAIGRSVLIGGGANLRSLQQHWAEEIGHETIIGNPWKGLSYPQELESRLHMLGPTYAVAVGLAMRGFAK